MLCYNIADVMGVSERKATAYLRFMVKTATAKRR